MIIIKMKTTNNYNVDDNYNINDNYNVNYVMTE